VVSGHAAGWVGVEEPFDLIAQADEVGDVAVDLGESLAQKGVRMGPGSCSEHGRGVRGRVGPLMP
jgi:hypothetical protein